LPSKWPPDGHGGDCTAVTSIYADAHVHIHDCFDLDDLFASALERAAELGGPLLLLLAESEGDNYFERCGRLAERGPDALAESDSEGAGRAAREMDPAAPPALSLRIRRTAEPRSLVIDRKDGSNAEVYLVTGCQKVSAERIEVLALCLDPADPLRGDPDGVLSTETLVRRVLGAGAVAVLPWGFGKWLGPRGAKVAELARRENLCDHPRFFLGDIAHRCWPWPTPKVFHGDIRVLPGTDPLPLSGLEGGLARYGFCVEGGWDPERPVGSLLGAMSGECRIEPVGCRDSSWTTLAQQLRYRMRRV
jgi:hypothetical protein